MSVVELNTQPDATNPAQRATLESTEMQPRSYNHSSYSQSESARRRIRRATSGHRLYCNTNGCTTLMQPDANGSAATCPICGARRAIH